ncbi:hypothetical protein MRBLWH7_001873 [Microbacterium sp. LWH7-1.2]|uniref:hypothetical protein n=1 Tax=Microbacterium sp. LWH7-1.2 TaxID=3135257 RepID=UPI0031399C69
MLAVSEVIVSTATFAVALVGAHAYSTGLEVQLQLHARRQDEDDAGWERVREIFFGRPGTPEGPGGNRALTYAVALDGGREVVAFSPFHHPRAWGEMPDGLSVMSTRPGGGGGPSSMASSPGLWLWGLPAAHRLELIVRWPAAAIAEARAEIDVNEVAGNVMARHLRIIETLGASAF